MPLSLLLLLQCLLMSGATDPIYLVTVTSQVVGGNRETLCAHIHEPKEILSIVVTLRTDNRNLTILQQGFIKTNFYKCVPFKVPLVTEESVASVNVAIRGSKTSLSKTTKILIKPPKNLLFIQSDKLTYKPGQTIKFRIVSLNSSLLPYNQVFRTVELQDPYLNRIGQWLNRTTRIGILDLSHSMSPEAAKGYYTITAWDDKKQKISHSFEVTEYVLPKYEVNIDFPIITFPDEEVTLKVCAKYTSGKPVLGSMNAEVCVHRYNYDGGSPNPEIDPHTVVCKKYSMMTDKTGCGSQVMNAAELSISVGGSYEVNCHVEETGTGVTLQAFTSGQLPQSYMQISMEDTPNAYRPGMPFKGKCVISHSIFGPAKYEPVVVNAYYGDKSVNVTLTTDINGTVHFSFNTLDWSEKPVTLQVLHEGALVGLHNDPDYPGHFSIRPIHSKSKSFLMLTQAPGKLSCNSNATVMASYIIQGKALKTGLKTLDFFYIVLSRGSMAQNGNVSVIVNAEKENKGELTFTLKKTAALAPYAQVVVYTVLPNGEIVADSMNFPTEDCLPNKVSLKFSSPTALPGEKTSLKLEASPGSLCSVQAVDESVLLLRPEAELNAASVLKMLPVQILSGYPYNVEGQEPNPCPYPDVKDVYNIFREVGIKIATNSDMKAPVACHNYETMLMGEPTMDNGWHVDSVESEMEFGPNVEKHTQKIRKFFQETWIWDLIPVGISGSVDIAKTVPDTNTKWVAGAFCTSRVGFGVALKTDLTAFKPFSVSLTLPYSIIRGETFTLTATVFNYLPKCIRVKVTLADSTQFTAQPCRGCTYTRCVCSEESKTFQWTVEPSEPGKVNITVRAGAVQSQELCGNEVVTLPDKGRINTVMQSILVEAEGTKQSITQNELICLKDGSQETSVSLTLPKVFVKGSAKSFVTVLGDLMGHVLKNFGDLSPMPYDSGEQNMLRFAPNIYILQYLESSKQLTPEIKDRAITFLESSYQKELTYKNYDGSYSAFGRTDFSGNTWLTAFVMKSFGGAKRYIFVDQANIEQAKDWLGRQQKRNGCFTSVGNLFSSLLSGGVKNEVTLSAYVTAALLELGIQKTDPMVAKSLACLKVSSRNIDNTYVTAMLSYTFTLAGDEQMRKNLLSNLDKQAKRIGVGRYWTLANNNAQPRDSVEVEMSAYVLLALLSGPSLPGFGLNYSAGIVHWLSKQNLYGGFTSTQDTVVALQALAKYSAATYNPEGIISLTVTSPSGQKNQFTVNQNRTRLLYQEKQLQEATGTYKLRAEGKGCVFVQFALHYNIPPPPDSLAFEISANTWFCTNTRKPAFTLTTTVRYRGTREETNMVIINIKILSGFKPDEMSLQFLRGDFTIKHVDLDKDRVILYLDSLKQNWEKFINLQLVQEVPVQNLKPAEVVVYDYYKISELSATDYTSPCA